MKVSVGYIMCDIATDWMQKQKTGQLPSIKPGIKEILQKCKQKVLFILTCDEFIIVILK